MSTEVEMVTLDFMSMISGMYAGADKALSLAQERYERSIEGQKAAEAMEAATQMVMHRAQRDTLAHLWKEAFGTELASAATFGNWPPKE